MDETGIGFPRQNSSARIIFSPCFTYFIETHKNKNARYTRKTLKRGYKGSDDGGGGVTTEFASHKLFSPVI